MAEMNDRLRALGRFEVAGRTATAELRELAGRRKRRQLAAGGIASALVVGLTIVAFNGGENRDGVSTTGEVTERGCLAGALIAAILEDPVATNPEPEVVIVGSDGRLEPVTPGWVSVQPSFNPAGDRLVVVRAHRFDADVGRPDRSELWSVGIDGLDPRKVTTGPLDDHPAWGPTGDIAFLRHDGAESALLVVPSTGGDPRTVYEPASGVWLATPAWSPDATKLAFVLGEATTGSQDRISLAVIDADGGTPKLIAEVGYPLSVDWHPDGRSLLATGGGGPFVVDAISGHKSKIEPDLAAARWAPEGDRIIFTGRDGTLLAGTLHDGLLTDTQQLTASKVSARYVYSDIDTSPCR